MATCNVQSLLNAGSQFRPLVLVNEALGVGCQQLANAQSATTVQALLNAGIQFRPLELNDALGVACQQLCNHTP